MPVVMTVAGSDSGGGAGLQADLKVFAALGVFGTAAVTCVTAQNPWKVAGVEPLRPAMVALQIRTVCAAFKVRAAKTGMLYSAGIIRAAARSLAAAGLEALVVDPVMIATSGGQLMQKQAFTALVSGLLPLATVITPNLHEAERLLNRRVGSLSALKAAARDLHARFGTACLVKGGHLPGRAGDCVVDVLCSAEGVTEFAVRRVRVKTTHGTGCRFSAALTAGLALGRPLAAAAAAAQQFVAASLQDPLYSGM